jgi:hypothetical protein
MHTVSGLKIIKRKGQILGDISLKEMPLRASGSGQ